RPACAAIIRPGYRLSGLQGVEVTQECRHGIGIDAVIVAANAALAVDEHEAVAVRDQLARTLTGAGRCLGDAQPEALADQLIERLAVAGEKPPIVATIRTEAGRILAQHLRGIV